MTEGQAGTAGSGDYYARRLATEAYRRSREEKAAVIAHLLEPYLRPDARLADIGTGTGIMKKALEAELGKRIWGFELDVPFVVERDGVVGADGCKLPVRDGSFDLVILNHIYEHVPDPRALFAETRRILAPGGHAYVSAGSRWAVMEPHYRLPFLSWLPRPMANGYLRLSGRATSYEGVRFLGYKGLKRAMEASGLIVHDITERALDELLSPERGAAWRPAWSALRRLPTPLRRGLLRASPQWFIMLERPASAPNRAGA